MTRDEAGKAFERLKQRVSGAQSDDRHTSGERQERSERSARHEHGEDDGIARIKGAVESGKLSREQAKGVIEEIRARLAGTEHRQHAAHGEHDVPRREVRDKDAIVARINAAVDSGKMSREEAQQAFEGIKKRMAMAEREKQSDSRRDAPDREAIMARVKSAVDSGKMSREEARKFIEVHKQRMAAQGKQGASKERQNTDSKADKNSEDVVRSIREAVKAGKLTGNDAEAKLKAMREKESGWRK